MTTKKEDFGESSSKKENPEIDNYNINNKNKNFTLETIRKKIKKSRENFRLPLIIGFKV
jgi:hypothetical protein